MIHIVLIHPKMPSNTGNIIRLCANTGASLHLLKPLGFELDDKKLRRAGLDYHEYANLKVYDSWHQLRAALLALNCAHIVALTTKFSRPFYDYSFDTIKQTSTTNNQTNYPTKNQTQVALVFGSETDGLPDEIREDIALHLNKATAPTSSADSNGLTGSNKQDKQAHWLRLPMLPESRSLNLSNSVAICLYEVWRQLGFDGDMGQSTGYHTPNQPLNAH